MSDTFIWNEKCERMSRGELESLQLGRLKTLIQRLYDRVPFYKQLMDERGVSAKSLNTLADLKNFPFTKKTDLRENYPFGLFFRTTVQCNSPARFIRNQRQTDRGRVHEKRHRHVVGSMCPFAGNSRSASGRHPAQQLRLWSFHWRSGNALRCRKIRRHSCPRIWWQKPNNKFCCFKILDRAFCARHHLML